MINRKYFLLTFFCAGTACVYAQAPAAPVKDTMKAAPVMAVVPPPPADTNIRVYAPAVVQNMEQMIYRYQRSIHSASPGFRVQIEFGQDRSVLAKTQADFSDKYPGMPSYISYKQPYFRVSAGDFRTKLEATRFYNKVKVDYPAAFIVADKITPPAL